MTWLPRIRFAGEPPPIVALHGFTQRAASLAEFAGLVRFECVALELPGHGPVRALPFRESVDAVAASIERPSVLLGYSQGGRLALGVALDHPRLVSGLVLISAGIGIDDEAARRERLWRDAERAATLTRDGLGAFLDRWLNQDLFSGLRHRSQAWRDGDRSVRLGNDAGRLADALLMMGQGAQPAYRARLGELAMPVLYLAGTGDPLYGDVGRAVADAAPNAELIMIRGAGHAVLGENPGKVAAAVDEWIRRVGLSRRE